MVHPIPHIVSNWLIGIGKLLATLIKLKVRTLYRILLHHSFAAAQDADAPLRSRSVIQVLSEPGRSYVLLHID